MKTPKDKRTTISMTQVVWDWAQEMMGSRGYNNLSSYITDLIRNDRDRHREKDERPKNSSSSRYPSTPGEQIRLEEKPAPKKSKAA